MKLTPILESDNLLYLLTAFDGTLSLLLGEAECDWFVFPHRMSRPIKSSLGLAGVLLIYEHYRKLTLNYKRK